MGIDHYLPSAHLPLTSPPFTLRLPSFSQHLPTPDLARLRREHDALKAKLKGTSVEELWDLKLLHGKGVLRGRRGVLQAVRRGRKAQYCTPPQVRQLEELQRGLRENALVEGMAPSAHPPPLAAPPSPRAQELSHTSTSRFWSTSTSSLHRQLNGEKRGHLEGLGSYIMSAQLSGAAVGALLGQMEGRVREQGEGYRRVGSVPPPGDLRPLGLGAWVRGTVPGRFSEELRRPVPPALRSDYRQHSERGEEGRRRAIAKDVMKRLYNTVGLRGPPPAFDHGTQPMPPLSALEGGGQLVQ